jgi:triacylglycerol esterase/lipase EstA (alpha/beta hydrolase family)
LPTNTIDNSRASPRVSLITKKGKGKSTDGSSAPTERNGLHLIYQPPPDLIETTAPNKQCPIDIVAVHGIMGDAYTTWTHSNGHFWLRDSLPEEVPGARIFSYGYPANVFLSLEKGRIHDHAITLLEDLRDMRKIPEDARRPIVFICHSMGGLVVKKVGNNRHASSLFP